MIDLINQEVMELWEKSYPENTEILSPLIYPEQPKDSFLFIGINPSFNESGERAERGNRSLKMKRAEQFKI